MNFAVISPWPKLKNAEYEVIERLKIAALNLGHQCIVVDNDGYTVDEKHVQISAKDVSFCIALHYISHKLFGIYTYAAMWNPPVYIAKWGYEHMITNILSCDDFLVYQSSAMLYYLDNLLTNTAKPLMGHLQLVPGVAGKIYEPNIENFKIFYCGINWERTTNSIGRHHNLFHALDKTGFMKIYGPNKFLGVRPWKGFKSYSGELPFDGVSIIKAISQCGVALVFSSDDHRKYGAVSSRIYESCAAGAVVISDDNPFILQEFGDSVLSIKHSDKWEENFSQILEKIKWIEQNKERAIQKARECQKIYVQKFSLEKMIGDITASHQNRLQQVYKKIRANNHNDIIDVIVILDKDIFVEVEKICAVLNEQIYQNINLIILASRNGKEAKSEIEKILIEKCNQNITRKIFVGDEVSVLAKNDGLSQCVTFGLMTFHALQSLKGNFFTFLSVHSCWDCNHLSSLKRVFEDNDDCFAAYSAFEVQSKKKGNGFEVSSFNHLVYSDKSSDIGLLLKFSSHIPEYSVLFKRDVSEDVLLRHLYFFDTIDCRFVIRLFLVNALIKGKVLFSQQMTAKYFTPIDNGNRTKKSERKKETFSELEQMVSLDDYFRNNEKYRHLYAIYANSNGGISIDYDTFKACFKQLLKNMIGDRPLPQSIARMFYRLLKRLSSIGK
ncbi:MAG: hypothetical protein A2X78_02985 [Gammaproteobacteria bacterium GWE2_37_16]|nr:MAG: hypothetical protein A2X78_02985 [Gammaproteobacteria bacterium GWE2_37_16]